jgi:hypothetical protein
MRAGVKESVSKRKNQNYRVIDLDHPEQSPILNRDGDPIDGGGHRIKGISEMLAGEVNAEIERKTGKPVVISEE